MPAHTDADVTLRSWIHRLIDGEADDAAVRWRTHHNTTNDTSSGPPTSVGRVLGGTSHTTATSYSSEATECECSCESLYACLA